VELPLEAVNEAEARDLLHQSGNNYRFAVLMVLGSDDEANTIATDLGLWPKLQDETPATLL